MATYYVHCNPNRKESMRSFLTTLGCQVEKDTYNSFEGVSVPHGKRRQFKLGVLRINAQR